MRKIVKILDNVCNINNFSVAEEILLTRGNQTDLFFQLATEKLDSLGDTSYQRYIPQGSSVVVEVQFDNIDLNYQIRRTAQLAFTGDGSIYKISLLSQDQLMFNSMRVSVFEDGVVSYFTVETDIATQDVGDRRKFT